MNTTSVILAFACAAGIAAGCGTVRTAGSADFGGPVGTARDIYENLPFKMDKVMDPVIPDRTLSIVDFGGVGDGTTLNTKAFSKAIDALEKHGGGHLEVPAGIWLTGPIRLKDGIDLHVTENAVIVFSSDKSLYPLVKTSFEGLDTYRCESPLSAEGAKNVSVTGKGILDGGGYEWRAVKKSKMTSDEWKRKVACGGVLNAKKDTWYPDETYMKIAEKADMNVPVGLSSMEEWEAAKSFLRPVMISFRSCENVLMRDVHVQNSPCWTIHPLMCRNVVVDNIAVRNPDYAQNSDGIDIESCENVVLTNSSFDVGDDGICIKSGKDEDGRKRAMPCRNLIVDGCNVYHGHGGFVVGSEMSGGVENVKVSNCRFMGTDVGLRFKSRRGRGGVVRNIFIDRIYMTDIVTDALLFDLFYNGTDPAAEFGKSGNGAPAVPVADVTTPEFRDITISNVVCKGAGRAMFFDGLPEMPVRNVSVDGCSISSVKGVELRYCEGVLIRNADIRCSEGEKFVQFETKDTKIE